VACYPLGEATDLLASPQLAARGFFVEHDDPELGPLVGPAVVPRFSETPGSVRWTGPWQPGSHNREVYCDLLGLSRGELEELAGSGIV
jgi:crotonobetainyl-CoA:carnitine CoA-transferase CaiB-like acyl-CoA transferase